MSEDVKFCRSYLKNKLLDSDLNNFSSQRNRLLDILQRNIEFGESDSVLIMGPRGCGKVSLINSVFNEIEKNSSLKDNFLRVRLHGLIHTDDNVAFRDIVRQLNVDDLSGEMICGSSSNMLSFTLQSLRSGEGGTLKSVIFILEEFQNFCVHKNQSLLYNLYDITQSKQVPICVIGITNKFDITELLEKRVKSRFSHNKIILYPPIKFEDRLNSFTSILTIPKNISLDPSFVRRWNKNIKKLSTNEVVISILQRQFDISKSQRYFHEFLFITISSLNEYQPMLSVEHIENASNLCTITCDYNPLESLSILELCLIISIYHHTEIHERMSFHFDTIYQRYIKFAKQAPSIITAERSLTMKAFESLEVMGFISKTENESSNKLLIYYEFLMNNHEIRDLLRNYKELPTELNKWAESSIEVA